MIAFDGIVSANADLDQRIAGWSGAFGNLSLWASAFGDAGVATGPRLPVTSLSQPVLVDAGVGIVIRGRLYDRDIHMRLDAPLVTNDPFEPPGLGRLPSAIRWSVDWR
jgi:hypothetical protein